MKIRHADGSIEPVLDKNGNPTNMVELTPEITVTHSLIGGPYDGRPVVATLENYLGNLRDHVLPTASQLLNDEPLNS